MQIIVTPNDRVIVILDHDAAEYTSRKHGRNTYASLIGSLVGRVEVEQGRYPVSVSYREGGIHVRLRHGPFGRTVQLDRRMTLDLAEDGTAQLLIIAE
jgi:hypothetical protein